MSRKIVLFLSDYKENAKDQLYFCPNGQTVNGTQTNDAPVKFLLQAYPDITEIIAVVTEQARSSAWVPFTQMVQETAPSVLATPVDFEESQDFSSGPLIQIMALVQSGDEIFLETTGGFRNAIMQLLLISRVLSYKGVRTAGAVYSNLSAKRIEDCSHLIDLFDLVNGMQELSSFGSVRTLRDYYSKQPEQSMDSKIHALLSAMEALSEDIMLCRTSRIDDRIQRVNAALNTAETCSEPLMRALLPVFREKFGQSLTTPSLIRWCVENDMIPQALTIYKERIPAYLIQNRSDILEVRPDAPEPEHLRNYEDIDTARFHEHLLKLGRNLRGGRFRVNANWSEQGEWQDYTVTTLEYLEQALPFSYFKIHCSVSQLRTILMDYLYIRLLRNMVHHANEESTDFQAQLMDYLSDSDYNYKRLEEVKAIDVKRALLRGLEHLQIQGR